MNVAATTISAIITGILMKGFIITPCLFVYPPNGSSSFQSAHFTNVALLIFTISVVITAIIPLAKNIPASVTING